MRVIAGSARHIPLETPAGQATRPTQDRIKETLFNMIAPRIPDASFLDLFAGSGGIGIEALSRGAAEAVFVDQSRDAAACIRRNLEKTRLSGRASLLPVSAKAAAARLSGHAPFDVIFMDPPYGKGLAQEMLELLRAGGLIGPDTLVIIEESLSEDPQAIAGEHFSVDRVKSYKTNMHLFLSLREHTP
ncbi:MAG: 16S rRNA (guanine(966)-N(2))-methyltransferase RsmD [Lachnospiraceae bacterium]|nr:16S rRNA (guanine(966)-N(2))-methyltransferase RsmD [Lachnospiraceae bacterium]